MDSANTWAQVMLGCGSEEAEARLKLAKNELEIRDAKKYRRGIDSARWPELIENGGHMARLRAAAQEGNADAAATVAEIEYAFLAYSYEKDTDKYGLKLLCAEHGLQPVAARAPIVGRILGAKGRPNRLDFLYTLQCGHVRTKRPHAEEGTAAMVMPRVVEIAASPNEVPCPSCGAPSGVNCYDSGAARELSGFWHWTRLRDYDCAKAGKE